MNNEKSLEKKQMVTEGTWLAHYAKDKDNIVTTDASKSRLVTEARWRNTKLITIDSRYLNETEENTPSMS